jgi:Predicted NADH:ubiquinone oxidoreductase, subunit RnfG
MDSRATIRPMLVHLGRVALLATILLLMNWQQARVLSELRARGLDAVPLNEIQSLFPEATALGTADSQGGRLVLNGDNVIGAVLQTFPEAEKFLGFSGPTNVLIGLGPDGGIVGLRILSSGDTRDHLALIERDSRFLNSLNGLDRNQAREKSVDAVTGATLTSLAILQGIRARLGKLPESLKFPVDYSLDDARQIFPEAAELDRDSSAPELWLVSNEKGEPLGWLLSNSPSGDEIIGYQGPTRAFLGMRLDGTILGLVVKESFDNEPYVGTVRGDRWFAQIFNDRPLEEWGKLSWEEAGIEGVSGATMTSQAVAEGLLVAARKITEIRQREQQQYQDAAEMRWKSVLTISVILMGLVVGFTRLRGNRWGRVAWKVLVIVALGVINADLLSMAMFVGWAQSGLPWRNAVGLICLAAAAITVPIVFKRNIYCDHLCPHGALQQLLPRRWKIRNLPRWIVRGLRLIRPALLTIIVLVPMLGWSMSLVDLEPFDAYAWRAAGVATVSIAVAGLGLSLFIPMAYCRYGCPTGAVLDYLRRNSRSDRLTAADGLAVLLCAIAFVCYRI